MKKKLQLLVLMAFMGLCAYNLQIVNAGNGNSIKFQAKTAHALVDAEKCEYKETSTGHVLTSWTTTDEECTGGYDYANTNCYGGGTIDCVQGSAPPTNVWVECWPM